jgi:type I restriction enzyme, S subunit
MTHAAPGSPPLRFPEFAGNWQVKRGGDAFDQRRERGEDGLPLYSVTIDRGIVRRDSLDREISSAMEDEGNLRVRQDDLAYNMMRMWQGAVGRAGKDGMVSPAYVVLAPKADTAPAFFEYWFKRSRSLYLLWAYSYGLTNDRLRLYFRDFSKVPMALPDRNEQQKIADFLSSLDERIALLTRKAEALLSYKREVARRLFSRELRFRRDDGSDFSDWKHVHLRDVATFAKGRGVSKDDISADGETPCIRYGELYTAYSERIECVISRTNVPLNQLLLSEKGDVILPASGELPLDMASASYVPMPGIALGGDINVIRSSLHGLFLAYLLRGPLRRSVGRLAQGNSVVHLYSSHLAGLALSVPSDIQEQQRIADFLSAIDDKIGAVRAKVTAMQTLKKGLLQKMFV